MHRSIKETSPVTVRNMGTDAKLADMKERVAII